MSPVDEAASQGTPAFVSPEQHANIRAAVEAVLFEWGPSEIDADYVRRVVREAINRAVPPPATPTDSADSPDAHRLALEWRIIQLDEESAAMLIDWRDLSAGEIAALLVEPRPASEEPAS